MDACRKFHSCITAEKREASKQRRLARADAVKERRASRKNAVLPPNAYPRVPGQLSHNGGIHPKQRHSCNNVIPATRSFALTSSLPRRRQSGKGNRAWRYSFWKWERARRISRNIRWIEHGNPGCRDLYGAICAQTGFPPFCAGMKMYIFTGMTL